MKIMIGKEGAIKTDFNNVIEVTGYEGVLSRVQAPTYLVHNNCRSPICKIKRHIFSNLPFFTIEYLDGGPSVKLSQEMSQFTIGYSIQGRGLSFSGDFEKGSIEIFQMQHSLGNLMAKPDGGDITVDIQPNSKDHTVLIGIGLAYGLMLAYLRRPLHADDES